ncbi:hypothetical protein [Sphingobacterium gobiense]|uniref:Uncharacterized protein n=1 Tax=Sphingobacterium gobiense TaxID=1382456 RepID=A0A2S9JU30_9SPHI|nr:hypothetical protein [Sphingobacterium gobiense]PRD56651.1 hypothetical protein C5749_05300 [Sphingobacterium gobiense]
MKKKDIWRYIHNWKGMLERHEAPSILQRLYADKSHFDFCVLDFMKSGAKNVHVYPGVSDDYEKLRFFVLSETFDRSTYRDSMDHYIYVSKPVKSTDQEADLKSDISEREAKRRIDRWNETFSGKAIDPAILDLLKVRCFIIPMEDISTCVNSAYFAFKVDKKTSVWSMDLIIRGCYDDQDDARSAPQASYDTIRLVPPFPPITEEQQFEILFD